MFGFLRKSGRAIKRQRVSGILIEDGLFRSIVRLERMNNRVANVREEKLAGGPWVIKLAYLVKVTIGRASSLLRLASDRDLD